MAAPDAGVWIAHVRKTARTQDTGGKASLGNRAHVGLALDPRHPLNLEISCIRVMIAQKIVFTRDFLKAPRIHDYGQLKKIPCGNKKQARACAIHKFSGLNGKSMTPVTETLKAARDSLVYYQRRMGYD